MATVDIQPETIIHCEKYPKYAIMPGVELLKNPAALKGVIEGVMGLCREMHPGQNCPETCELNVALAKVNRAIAAESVKEA